jgi:hypothetical protein
MMRLPRPFKLLRGCRAMDVGFGKAHAPETSGERHVKRQHDGERRRAIRAAPRLGAERPLWLGTMEADPPRRS